jgi:hypothetical protein
MTAHELAKKLLELPDFEVQFVGWAAHYSAEYGADMVTVRFNTVYIADVGHSDKVVVISGDEVD